MKYSKHHAYKLAKSTAASPPRWKRRFAKAVGLKLKDRRAADQEIQLRKKGVSPDPSQVAPTDALLTPLRRQRNGLVEAFRAREATIRSI